MNPDKFNPFDDGLNVKDKCSNGYPVEDLAATAHSVFCKLVGDNRFVRTAPWSSLDTASQEMWLPVIRMAIAIMDLPDEQAEVNVSVSALAKNFYRQFTALNDAPTFETLDFRMVGAWHAIVRHLANLIESDGSLNFADMEERIVDWAKAKQGNYQLV